MMRALKSVPWLVLLLLLLAHSLGASSAGWIREGVAVCSAPYNQTQIRMVSDGAGGAIIVWVDNRASGIADIYAQKIDFAGIPRWTADGVAICTASANQTGPQLIADGAGGAIITWQDARNGNWDIYAQRVNASGVVLWTPDGVSVCAASSHQFVPQIASDGTAGAIIVWQDIRGGTYYDIYGQRVNASGVTQWIGNGVGICTASNSQTAPQLTTDGAGGAIVVWQDYRNATAPDLYAQRVNSAGSSLWTSTGVVVIIEENDQTNPTIVSDMSNGAIVTWQENTSGSLNIMAQRLDPTGAYLWQEWGEYVCISTGGQEYPQSVSDGAGGALIVWEDYRAGSFDVYGQRLSAGAGQYWPDNGLGHPISTGSGDQTRPYICSDGTGGAIVTWADTRNGESDIYVQRIDASHELVWGDSQGLALCVAGGAQVFPHIVTDGAGGAIVAWEDSRLGFSDIYAQRVLMNGLKGTVLPRLVDVKDVPNDQGGKVAARWLASDYDSAPGSIITHYLVWKSIDFPAAAALMRSGADAASASGVPASADQGSVRKTSLGALDYWWECVGSTPAHFFEQYSMTCPTSFDSMGTDPGMHSFFVSACTADAFVFYDSAIDSGYSVDNLSPGAPAALAGEQSYEPAGLALSWESNTESDLSHYAVYRGARATFLIGPQNLIAEPTDPGWFDDEWTWSGTYFYKVAAVDVHGNLSPVALLRPADVTGVETPKAPEVTYLRQNFPNPFNPTTRITFGLAAPGNVSLRIYDAAGRLVRVLAEGARPAGNYTELWDGRDSGGRAVASGIYFYRLTAGPFSETRKMALLR